MTSQDKEYWLFEGRSGEEGEPYTHWCKHPHIRNGVYREIWEFLEEELPISLEPERIIVNAYNHGDSSWLHRDSDLENNYTVILYINPEWDWNWGGETIFIQNGGEIILTVSPTPGRVVLFDGRILHGPRPVSREAPFPRVGVTFQCIKQSKT